MCADEATCDNDSEETTVYPLRTAARRIAARGCAALSLSVVFFLAGCHNFFVCEKASCPSSGTTTGDWVYVSNAAAGSTDVAAYDIGSGALTTISGSPFNLGFAPVALNVSPSNGFLYAATPAGATNPGIYLWSINSSTGALTKANSGNVLVNIQAASMDISPDGNYLFAVDVAATALTEYKITTSSGLLQLVTSFPLPAATCSPITSPVVSQSCTVTVAPSGQFVLASLGTAGTVIYPYTSASGITTTSPITIPSGSTQANPSGDFSVALDKNNFAYIARTAALAVYSLDSSGNATLKSTATYDSTAIPRSVVLGTSNNFVYTANIGEGDISGYGIGSTGALTTIAGQPFTGPANVSAIGADRSGKYMVAAGYNGTSGFQLFSISSTTGALTLVTSAGTGTSADFPAVLALTH